MTPFIQIMFLKKLCRLLFDLVSIVYILRRGLAQAFIKSIFTLNSTHAALFIDSAFASFGEGLVEVCGKYRSWNCENDRFFRE